MPAIYHEGSWLGNATDPEVLVKDTVGWTGKNLLINTYPSQTVNGITITHNEDESLSFSGTATEQIVVVIKRRLNTLKTGQKYILSGITGGSNSSYFITYNSGITDPYYINVYDGEGEFIAVNESDYPQTFVGLYIRSGQNMTGITIKPMIRRADIVDETYEPYHESVEEEIEQIYADNGVLGAKNLFKLNNVGRTVNGVTFTLNDDNSFTANGTATVDTYFESHIMSAKANDVYIVSDNLANPSDSTYRGKVMGKTTGIDYAFLITGKEKKFTVTNTENIVYSFKVKSGQTVNNITFKPMLRLASDPDDTYQPYAMTNRELTEKKIDAELTFVTGVSVDTLTENKRYYCSGGMTGLPTGNIGYLDVHRSRAGEGIHQTFYPAGVQGEIYVRRYWDNAWGSWYKFTGTVVS